MLKFTPKIRLGMLINVTLIKKTCSLLGDGTWQLHRVYSEWIKCILRRLQIITLLDYLWERIRAKELWN